MFQRGRKGNGNQIYPAPKTINLAKHLISAPLSIYLSIYLSIDSLPRRPNHSLTNLSFPVSTPPRNLFRSQTGLGASWNGVGGLLGALGGVFGLFWHLLGRSWELLGWSWVVLGGSWTLLASFWTAPGASWEAPGAIQNRSKNRSENRSENRVGSGTARIGDGATPADVSEGSED